MVVPKSKSGIQRGAGSQGRATEKQARTIAASFVGRARALPKGASGSKFKLPDFVSMEPIRENQGFKRLLRIYGDEIKKSWAVGRPVSFKVVVDPKGKTVWTPFEVKHEPVLAKESTDNDDLEAALGAARERGRLRAADILGGKDMLSADAFAKMLGTTRVTVNTKRQNGQVLGLDGAKRGFRFPVWQIGSEGKPYASLVELHQLLGGPWGVYRFLMQPHGELDGLTGREALNRGRIKAVLQAAESVGRDFR
jgi:hypothetical protein